MSKQIEEIKQEAREELKNLDLTYIDSDGSKSYQSLNSWQLENVQAFLDKQIMKAYEAGKEEKEECDCHCHICTCEKDYAASCIMSPNCKHCVEGKSNV